MSRVKFNVKDFEQSRKNFNKIPVYCSGIKEEMEILDIEYFPEGVLKGLSPNESTMVVASSKNGLFCPKVYIGDGKLFWENGTAWKSNWDESQDSEGNDIIDYESRSEIIYRFTDWVCRNNVQENSPFNLVVYENELSYSKEVCFTDTWIHDDVNSEISLPLNLYISAKEMYDYIKTLISNTCICSSKNDDYEICKYIQDKMREAYYNVIDFFKCYDNYAYVDDTLKTVKNTEDIIDVDTYMQLKGTGEVEPNPTAVAINGEICEGVRPEHKEHQCDNCYNHYSETKTKCSCNSNNKYYSYKDINKDERYSKPKVTVVDRNGVEKDAPKTIIQQLSEEYERIGNTVKIANDGNAYKGVEPSVHFSLNDVTVS